MSEPTAAGRLTIRWYALVLTLAQLALLCLCAWSLWVIAGGWWVGAAAAASCVLLLGLGWLLLLAPGSPKRLNFRDRLTASLVCGTGVVVVASLADVWVPAMVALSMAITCDSLNERAVANTRRVPT